MKESTKLILQDHTGFGPHVSSLDFNSGERIPMLDDGHVQQELDYLSLSIIFSCCFVGDTARGLMMPTLWPFVSSMGGNLIWQGFIVAAFSLGRVISSPLFGTLADMYGYRWVLVACNGIIVLGALLYTQSTTLEELFASQFVIGIGTGTLGVTRSYVAENSTKQNRTEMVISLHINIDSFTSCF